MDLAILKNRFIGFVSAGKSDIRYSNLYGFGRDVSCNIFMVESEATIIKFVITSISIGHNSRSIKADLDEKNLRNRSGKPFTILEIENMVRPIFTGIIRNRFGFYVRSRVYQPIVDRQTYQKASRMLKSTGRDACISLPERHSGVIGMLRYVRT